MERKPNIHFMPSEEELEKERLEILKEINIDNKKCLFPDLPTRLKRT